MKQHNGNGIHREADKRPPVKKGRLYFSKETERKLFFVLTLIMLLAGACFKLGFWQ